VNTSSSAFLNEYVHQGSGTGLTSGALLAVYRMQQGENCKVAYFHYSKLMDMVYRMNKVLSGNKKMADITATLINNLISYKCIGMMT
jgi:hypothetical protein